MSDRTPYAVKPLQNEYNVKVTLKVESSRHHDELFPDRTSTIEFDATDLTIDSLLYQFKDFLIMMGYVIDPFDSLKLVKDNQ